jgi:hypothetical protein
MYGTHILTSHLYYNIVKSIRNLTTDGEYKMSAPLHFSKDFNVEVVATHKKWRNSSGKVTTSNLPVTDQCTKFLAKNG